MKHFENEYFKIGKPNKRYCLKLLRPIPTSNMTGLALNENSALVATYLMAQLPLK